MMNMDVSTLLELGFDETAQDARLQTLLQDLRLTREKLLILRCSDTDVRSKNLVLVFFENLAKVELQDLDQERLIDSLEEVRLLYEELSSSGGRELKKLHQIVNKGKIVIQTNERYGYPENDSLIKGFTTSSQRCTDVLAATFFVMNIDKKTKVL